MIAEITFEPGKAIDILLDLKEQRTFYFDELSDREKAALNQKELIEDNYFIRVQHPRPEIQEKIDELCPLNFFVNEICSFSHITRMIRNFAKLCRAIPI